MYGKMINGELSYAPRKLTGVPVEFPPAEEGGEPVTMLCTVTNPTPEQYAAAGWLPVAETQRPADGDGYHYEAGYELDGGQIVQVWERVDDPAPSDADEISAEEALDIIFGGDNDAVD